MGSKIAADNDCRHEIKRHLLLGRKAMTKLDSVLKSGDITLLMKVHIVNIPVVIHILLNMRVEPQRRLSIEELMLSNRGAGEDSRVHWTARKSNQSILKEINPEYSLEGLMLKLKLQYFGHLMGRADSLENTLMLGKIEVRRGLERMR